MGAIDSFPLDGSILTIYNTNAAIYMATIKAPNWTFKIKMTIQGSNPI